MSHTQKIFIQGAAGNLETLIEPPFISPAKLVGIICHPHPLHEGNMQNKVVTTVVKVFQRLEITPIRFNFRGVGLSEGVHDYAKGELDDLRSVIHWAKSNYPDCQLVLAGFSFGSYIATKVATEVNPVALITIAPPVHHNDFKSLPLIQFPWVVVQGEADEVVPPDQVFTWIEQLSIKPTLISMPNVGHFFHGELVTLRDLLVEKLTPLLPPRAR
ncbi:MAG: alpha/beta hydrolase [Gammaproteobacteria bacterium]|nr:alpha/beta hydrolase [Gammaproteobacteria bacterium]